MASQSKKIREKTTKSASKKLAPQTASAKKVVAKKALTGVVTKSAAVKVGEAKTPGGKTSPPSDPRETAKKAVKKVAASKTAVSSKSSGNVKSEDQLKKLNAAKKPKPKKARAGKATVTLEATPKGTYELPEQMRDAVLKVLDERQAEEIVCITLTGRSSVADYLIIASGRAGRQVAAIADHLREAFFKLGVKHIRIEGQGEANWVLVDAGDVVVHLFRPEVRRYYDLDGMWNGKPVK